MFPARDKRKPPSLLDWCVYKHSSGRGMLVPRGFMSIPQDWTPCTPSQWFSENGKRTKKVDHILSKMWFITSKDRRKTHFIPSFECQTRKRSWTKDAFDTFVILSPYMLHLVLQCIILSFSGYILSSLGILSRMKKKFRK